MNRRILILPAASIVLVFVLVMRPDITGFMATKPLSDSGGISANVSVTIGKDGFIPENSTVTVYLDERSASMKFGDFVARTGAAYDRIRGQVAAINYEGYGYGGEYTYALSVSQFGIDTLVGSGNHTVTIEVRYEGVVLSSSSQAIET